MLKKIIFLIGTLLLTSIVAYASVVALSDTYRVELGQHTFEIPKQYSREGWMPQWLSSAPGLDDGSRAYLLEFPAEELAEAVPGYQPMDGRYREDIVAILYALTPVEVARYSESDRYRDLRDLWDATGSYRERIVEAYPDRPWFKVYRKIEYPDVWAVVKQSPESGEPLPNKPSEFWIASCRATTSPITETGKLERCSTYAFYDDTAIEFSVRGKNLHLIDEIRTYLRSKVESWRVTDKEPDSQKRRD